MSAADVHASWGGSAFNRGLVFRLAELGCRVLGRRAALAASDSLMEWYQGASPATAAAVARNLRLAFPSLHARDVEELTGRTFRNYGRGVVDYLTTETHPPVILPDDGSEERLRNVTGGKILVTSHMGNWEVGGLFLGRTVGPHAVVGFPERDPGVESYRKTKRGSAGLVTLSARSGLATLFRLREILGRGESIVVLVDRSAGADSQEVIFRGRPSRFLRSPALLATLASVPLVPTAVMAEGPSRYRALVGAPVAPGEPSKVMQDMADFFSGVLERYPDQWYNFFSYWREAP
jgi:lauroyl/myristoyl acyltransferase